MRPRKTCRPERLTGTFASSITYLPPNPTYKCKVQSRYLSYRVQDLTVGLVRENIVHYRSVPDGLRDGRAILASQFTHIVSLLSSVQDVG